MIFPVRCFTCGKVLSDKSEYYYSQLKGKGSDNTIEINNTKVTSTEAGILLDKLNINRYCCRRIFLSHVDLIEN